MVVEREVNGTNQTTPGRGGRSLFKKDLTGPTLLEMSGNPTYRDLALRKFAGHLSRMIRVTCDMAIYRQ